MATFKTTAGRNVGHCHVRLVNPLDSCRKKEWTNAEKKQRREELAAIFPNVTEVLEPSCKYNCFGYAYTKSHAWFNKPDFFIADDFTDVSMAEPQLGDVLVYKDDEDEFTHSGFVEEIAGGKITKVRSKWGRSAVVIHGPREVPLEFYGEPVRLIRRNV